MINPAIMKNVLKYGGAVLLEAGVVAGGSILGKRFTSKDKIKREESLKQMCLDLYKSGDLTKIEKYYVDELIENKRFDKAETIINLAVRGTDKYKDEDED